MRIPHPLRVLWSTLVLAALASPALAGDAVRLVVELPSDLGVLRPSATVDVQVVGVDDSGERCGFGGDQVVLSASHGSVEDVKRPYSFRYTAPPEAAGRVRVTLSAHLRGKPAVRGSAELLVVGAPRTEAAPFEKLLLRPTGDTNVPFDGTLTVEILGVRGGGGETLLTDQPVDVTVEGGPAGATALGDVTRAGAAAVRYTAPPRGAGVPRGTELRLVARLRSHTEVEGSLTIHLGRKREGPEAEPPAPPPDPAPPAPTTESEEDKAGVLWPSGNIRVAVWRTREADGEYPKEPRKLPAAGGRFVAPQAVQKIRVVIENEAVVGLSMEWYLGGKQDAEIHREKSSSDGPFRVTRNKDGKASVHIELPVPEDKTPVHAFLLLSLSDRRVVREEFVFVRGHDRDRDGVKDGLGK